MTNPTDKSTLFDIIAHYTKDKSVLDIGCIDHDIRRINRHKIWIHAFIKKHSKELVGLDILKEEVEFLRSRGYNIYCQNAENFSLNKKFDVIFAGELIEHLSNPGLFLERCKKHLKEKGLLIITTPNAFSVRRFFSILKHRSNDPPTNKEHTHWHSPSTLQELCRRNGFTKLKMYYVPLPRRKMNFSNMVAMIATKIIGKIFRERMILILEKAKD